MRIYRGAGCNLPGWRWATITKVALDRLSRSLHSDVCDSDGLRDAAIHSTISGRGGRRDRAASNKFPRDNILREGITHFARKVRLLRSGFRSFAAVGTLGAIAAAVLLQEISKIRYTFLSVRDILAQCQFRPQILRKIGYTSRFVRVILAQGPC